MSEPLENAASRQKSPLLWFIFKLTIAVALMGWLVGSGALDFSALRIFVDHPSLLVLNLMVFALCALASALRWLLLLRTVDTFVPFGKGIGLQLVGLFFNVATPGNVGGDLVKAVMVAREEPSGKRAGIFVVPLIERLIGLVGLLAMAALLLPISSYESRSLANSVLVLAAGSLIAPTLVMLLIRWRGQRMVTRLGGSSRLARLVSKVLEALILMARNPVQVVWALLLSMFVHGIGMAYFWLLVEVVSGQSTSLGTVASVFPLGNLVLVVPITPSGFGIGHLAFEELMLANGLHSGATVFNVYLIGMITPALLGLFPYLTRRRSMTGSTPG